MEIKESGNIGWTQWWEYEIISPSFQTSTKLKYNIGLTRLIGILCSGIQWSSYSSVWDFEEIYKKPSCDNIENVIKIYSDFPHLVSKEDNHLFLKDVTLEELQDSMNSFEKKEAKPEWMDYWVLPWFFDLIGVDILRVKEKNFQTSQVLGYFNLTFIYLTPNTDKVVTL